MTALPMADSEAASVRLGQFLDLAGRWIGATDDVRDLSHRIARTASLLLDIPHVAICLSQPDRGDAIAGASTAGATLEAADAAAVQAALASRSPQLRGTGEASLGAFPFRASDGPEGCLFVQLPRPHFTATEISLLRFVAALAGVLIASTEAAKRSAAEGAARAPSPPDKAPDAEISPSAAPPLPSELRNGGAPVTESAARRYVAMAVHDLRNPLNVVAGYAALLEEGSLGSITPEQREAIEAIGRQARVLHGAVDQLIELDRMATHDELQTSTFQVRTLFDDIRNTCFPDANGRVRWPGREAEFDFQSDRRRLYSVVQNLVDNALKHTAEDEVFVACERSDEHLVVLVCDHGPGLSDELRRKLVAQARTGAETAPRSGLGLYSVASHVHALGGAVDVEVAPAGGTAVRVTIPPSDVSSDARSRGPRTNDARDEDDAVGPRSSPAEGENGARRRPTRRKRSARDASSDP